MNEYLHTKPKRTPKEEQLFGGSYVLFGYTKPGWLPLIVAIQPFADKMTNNTRHDGSWKWHKHLHI